MFSKGSRKRGYSKRIYKRHTPVEKAQTGEGLDEEHHSMEAHPPMDMAHDEVPQIVEEPLYHRGMNVDTETLPGYELKRRLLLKSKRRPSKKPSRRRLIKIKGEGVIGNFTGFNKWVKDHAMKGIHKELKIPHMSKNFLKNIKLPKAPKTITKEHIREVSKAILKPIVLHKLRHHAKQSGGGLPAVLKGEGFAKTLTSIGPKLLGYLNKGVEGILKTVVTKVMMPDMFGVEGDGIRGGALRPAGYRGGALSLAGMGLYGGALFLPGSGFKKFAKLLGETINKFLSSKGAKTAGKVIKTMADVGSIAMPILAPAKTGLVKGVKLVSGIDKLAKKKKK